VLHERRQGHAEGFREHTGGFGAGREAGQDGAARGVAQGLEQAVEAGVGVDQRSSLAMVTWVARSVDWVVATA
jgi:hypothetical protein